MEEKYLLLDRFEREIETPVLYDTLDEARKAMKAALIEALDGTDDSILDEYTKGEDYDWEPDEDSAWLNQRRGNSDWVIVSFKDILSHTPRMKSVKGEGVC